MKALPKQPAKLAHYRCCGCKHEWWGKPGPVTCPNCQHVYVVWLNYDEVDWLGDDFGRAWNRRA